MCPKEWGLASGARASIIWCQSFYLFALSHFYLWLYSGRDWTRSWCSYRCGEHCDWEQHGEERVILQKSSRKGSHKAEALEGHCLVASSPQLSQQAFLYLPGIAHTPTTNSWAHPHLDQSRQGSPDLPTGYLMEALSQLRFLFPGNVNLCQAGKK